MKAKRLKWAKQWCDKDVDFWRSVYFSDESTFEILPNKSQYMHRRTGEKFDPDCIIQTLKHATKVMIWSVICGKDAGKLDATVSPDLLKVTTITGSSKWKVVIVVASAFDRAQLVEGH
ncbi:uncharacterized protein LOC126137920 [Schistocerca cancellata]|uniref:uncharacterized protein LOC126137920 n=1 Tax=Schistocerca cancellata TaxID=274614 RepID=UPI002118AD27|nr:uncharacterized protein LOC126137920 [Schistocerca cancellata]